MGLKRNIAIFSIAATIAGVGFQALGPHDKSQDEIDRQRQTQQLKDASEADKKSKAKMRQDGEDLSEANRKEKLRPVEVRPAEIRPRRIPFRVP